MLVNENPVSKFQPEPNLNLRDEQLCGVPALMLALALKS